MVASSRLNRRSVFRRAYFVANLVHTLLGVAVVQLVHHRPLGAEVLLTVVLGTLILPLVVVFNLVQSVGTVLRGDVFNRGGAMLWLGWCVAYGPMVYATYRLLRRRYPARRDGIVCGRCGYDLRATLDTCPECGTRRTLPLAEDAAHT